LNPTNPSWPLQQTKRAIGVLANSASASTPSFTLGTYSFTRYNNFITVNATTGQITILIAGIYRVWGNVGGQTSTAANSGWLVQAYGGPTSSTAIAGARASFQSISATESASMGAGFVSLVTCAVGDILTIQGGASNGATSVIAFEFGAELIA
jgi:hypothetical protein